MTAPALGSILLATTNADRLRRWYCDAFGVSPNPDGFLELGGVAVLIDQRNDVADLAAEPARTILNFHVTDARATAAHLDRMGVTWLVSVEFRGDAWFGTLHDPDKNIIQIIELTPAYFAARGKPTALGRSLVSNRLPAQDLARARAFYADKLGLQPVEERPGGLRYECGGGVFALFESAGRPSGAHTQMSWEVDDLDATVAELRSRGVVFEEYSLPGISTHEGIAEVEGNYPSRGGIGERAAWFHDSEGNLLGIGQSISGR